MRPHTRETVYNIIQWMEETSACEHQYSHAILYIQIPNFHTYQKYEVWAYGLHKATAETEDEAKAFLGQAIVEIERQDPQRVEAARNYDPNLKPLRWYQHRGRLIVTVLLLVVIVGAVGIAFNFIHSTGQSQPSTQTVVSAYPPVDGVFCDQVEQKTYLIHTHLTIYVNGKNITVPQNIGIAPDGSCYYWLYTHDTSDIVFVGAPVKGNYTLKQFIDIWGRQFSNNGYPKQLSSASGWITYVNGKQITGGFDTVVFTNHMLVTLAYNSPGIHPDTQYNWPLGI